MKTAVLFPGQGCQKAGMGAWALEACPDLRALYELGSQLLGFDLYRVCMDGTAEEFAQTRFVQPALYVTAVACLEAARRRGFTYDGAAGHSLGEYAAMTACGILSPRVGFRALQMRGAAMDKAAKESESGMCAIIGLAPDKIAAICDQTEGYVLPVNFNSPDQTVIAGDLPALTAAAEACKAAGAKKVAQLAVAAAFHSERMASAAAEIQTAFAGIDFWSPTCALYSNLTGEVLPAGTAFPAYCANHCTHPVRFTDSLLAMQRDGFTRFVEFGPRKVLTRFVQQTLPEAEALYVGDAKSLDQLFA